MHLFNPITSSSADNTSTLLHPRENCSSPKVYVIVLTFAGGCVFGVGFLSAIFYVVRRRSGMERYQQPSNNNDSRRQDEINNPIYENVD